MIRTLAVVACLLVASVAVAQKPIEPPIPSQEELEKDFSETLSGATLVGRFTTTGEDADKPLKEDKYTLGKVAKLPNGLWLFETRIQYGERDVKLPLAVHVKWAGDTPVITLTDLLVPGMGKFTARVLVYRGQYAGTWSGADHGGQMFGKVVKAGSEPEKPAEKSAEKPAAAK